ncbi:MAG: transposase [Nitrospira sp.]|nr:transposase [Nitrospira sp.]
MLGQEGVRTRRGSSSAKVRAEAVAVLKAADVSISRITEELGLGATVLRHWRRELREEQHPGVSRPGAATR